MSIKNTRRKILFNAAIAEETRVAIMDGDRVIDFDIEISNRCPQKGNILRAKVVRIETSLNAAFLDYGAQKHGFLPLKELSGNQSLKEGQELMVQIDKEERGNKGAALTTYISLPGCYLVLMPNSQNAGGISRRIEGEERQQLKEILNQLTVPKDMSVIVRTAGLGRSSEELNWDLSTLIKLWDAIEKAYHSKTGPCLIYQESDVILRSLRDYLREDISEIILDNQDVYQRVLQYVKQFRPDFVTSLHFYSDPIPLFTKYKAEQQIETAYQREVSLPQGGSIVIDQAEALTAIDINSARATKADNIEATAFQTNLEAADEIARQLRLRDLGGLIVIDFIDMTDNGNRNKVQERLAQALKQDRARVQLGEISKFGLLEMSRQRLHPALSEHTQLTCPRCQGQGFIRDVQSLGTALMRSIKDALLKTNGSELTVVVPISVSAYLLNEKRYELHQMEKSHQARIVIIPNPHMETPNFEIKRRSNKEGTPSYELLNNTPAESLEYNPGEITPRQEPAVKQLENTAAPQQKAKRGGIFSKISEMLFASNDAPVSKPAANQARTSTTDQASRPPRSQHPRQNPNKSRPQPGKTEVKTEDRTDGRPEKQGRNRNPGNAGAPQNTAERPKTGQKQARPERGPRNPQAPKAEAPRSDSQAPRAPSAPTAKPIPVVTPKPKPVEAPLLKTGIPLGLKETVVGAMTYQEVIEGTTFSLEAAKIRIEAQNRQPITRVAAKEESKIPQQSSLLSIQEEVLGEK